MSAYVAGWCSSQHLRNVALQARILVRKHRAKTDLIQKYVIVQFSLASVSILHELSLLLLLLLL